MTIHLIHSIISSMSLFSRAKSSSENEVYIYYGKIEKMHSSSSRRSKEPCLKNHECTGITCLTRFLWQPKYRVRRNLRYAKPSFAFSNPSPSAVF